ncbi:STAS domain-containing protein [Pelovirga terrestris]|uniref:Anti-sigma factor antagonist n=1 Tax=Pelovirga terrestris TaxID=2771352 RepID=A0A8J6R645_9BACT|nr:STAS domain-containing protein [Pelovirga terrestris]MBD1400989.1 STAS domain-containing protein [Pelovirga terrestris]
MQLKINEQEDNVIITVEEERMDAHNSGNLKERMLQLFDEGKYQLVIDLTAVRFIDSSGLGALVSGFKNASARDGSLKLCCLQPQVRSMFELTRLHRVFEIFSTLQEALDSQS